MYKVVVVDDSALMRGLLKDIINSIEGFEVIALANDAYDARQKIKEYEPDLVTIDINMSKMDGITFLKNLIRLHHMPAIIISGQNAIENDMFNDGAIGFVKKPEFGEKIIDFKQRIEQTFLNIIFLLDKYALSKPFALKKIDESSMEVNDNEKVHPDEVILLKDTKSFEEKVIAIGSSTGGVESLLKIFKKLPSNLPPILIVQHIPCGFSNSFAQRLNKNSEVNVCEAKDNEILERGCAYLAPGNMHLTIENFNNVIKIKLLDSKKVSYHKPSVDVLFRSVNNTVGGNCMAIIMTGMGDDGTIAIKELFDNGAYTVAQNEESCVVFGMPMKAIEAGAIKEIVHLDKISECIIRFSN